MAEHSPPITRLHSETRSVPTSEWQESSSDSACRPEAAARPLTDTAATLRRRTQWSDSHRASSRWTPSGPVTGCQDAVIPLPRRAAPSAPEAGAPPMAWSTLLSSGLSASLRRIAAGVAPADPRVRAPEWNGRRWKALRTVTWTSPPVKHPSMRQGRPARHNSRAAGQSPRSGPCGPQQLEHPEASPARAPADRP